MVLADPPAAEPADPDRAASTVPAVHASSDVLSVARFGPPARPD
jgi:hypothetical protein